MQQRGSNRPRRRAQDGKSQWVELRSVFPSVWGDQPHLTCFLAVLKRAEKSGFGWVGVAVHRAEVQGVVWRLERKAAADRPLPIIKRRRFRCIDARPGADAPILDGVRHGPLAVPQDASVRREGEGITVHDRGEALVAKAGRWLGEAFRCSLLPGATAAFVCSVRDHRVVWMGVYVGAVPRPWIDVPPPKRP